MITLDSTNAHYVHLLGVARLKVGDYKEAEKFLQAACQLNPKRASHWYALGKALEDSGNRRGEALAAYTKALDTDPHYGKARLRRSRLENDEEGANL